MKHVCFLITLSLCCMAVEVCAQSQMQSIHGRTKDGKELKVDYYKGTVEDYMENVKYQVVDELQAQIKTLEAAVARRDRLIDTLTQASAEAEALSEKYMQKEIQIDSLNNTITALNMTLHNLQLDRAARQDRPQEAVTGGRNGDMSFFIGLPARTPVIGVTAAAGPVLYDRDNEDMTVKDFRWFTQAALYFGTGRWGLNFPFSMEAGVGWRAISVLAPPDENTFFWFDNNQTLNRVKEKMTVKYLDFPVQCCFGQPSSSRITVYGKFGVTPSICLSSDYRIVSPHGEEPPGRVVLPVNMETVAAEPEARSFALWAHAAFGTYIPAGCLRPVRYASSLLFKAGIRCEYAVTPMIDHKPVEDATGYTADSAWDGLRTFLPAIEIGLVYTLK
ncbi:MAG: hypothetical protein K6F98_05310 [Bacteroidales bacterium]|nr:hypothetical protein [Bacteroidales bacterium]